MQNFNTQNKKVKAAQKKNQATLQSQVAVQSPSPPQAKKQGSKVAELRKSVAEISPPAAKKESAAAAAQKASQSKRAEVTQAITKRKKVPMWKQTLQSKILLTQVSQPMKNTRSDLYKNVKYILVFRYRKQDQPDVEYQKTVRIGDINVTDWVDIHKEKTEMSTSEQLQLSKRLSKLKRMDHPMHKDFWVYHLLNTGPDISRNYMTLLQKYKII